MAKEKKASFKELVEAIDEIKDCWKPGLQALGQNSKKVNAADKSLLCGSVDLDGCLAEQKLYSQQNRWDYIICYNGKLYFVEVHGAYTSEVSVVNSKKEWLIDWLNSTGKSLLLNAAPPEHRFHWIQSKKFNIPSTSSQARSFVKTGMRPKGELVLK